MCKYSMPPGLWSMNVCANCMSNRTHILIIGIGNPLRSDDGLGWAVAEQLSQCLEMRPCNGASAPTAAAVSCVERLYLEMRPCNGASAPTAAAVSRVERWYRDMNCDIHTVYQLTPELAEWMAAVNLVVMIDASHEGEPGELRIRPLSLSAQPSAVGTHYTTPEELAALTAVVYGQCPPVVVVTMTGANFSLGEQLSSIVAQRIPLVRAAVRQVCSMH
jgi:hydrogenase maturation protease